MKGTATTSSGSTEKPEQRLTQRTFEAYDLKTLSALFLLSNIN